MLIDKRLFLVFVLAHLLEVGEEVGFLFGLIQEAKLFIDERLYLMQRITSALFNISLLNSRSISFLG